MKRKVFFKFLFIAFAASVAVYLGACKKDIVTPINNSQASLEDENYSAEARRVVERIKRFKTQITEKEYLTKGDSFVPIDSVIWDVEALFNASHSFPDRKYIETVKQDIELCVETNAEDKVLLSASAVLYDDIVDAVRQVYANDGVAFDKSLMAIDVEEGEKTGNTVNVKVHVISGRVMNSGTPPPCPINGPFGPGDCWYFGEYGGTCDDPSVFGDAAEIIEDSINCHFRGKSVPSSGYRSINYNLVRVFLDGNEYVDDDGNYYTYFYSINDNPPFYLNYNLLNYYYNKELALILNVVPSDPVYQGMWPSDPVFLEVDIMGLIGNVGNQSCAYHKNAITYCCSEMVPVDVLFTPTDLLYY